VRNVGGVCVIGQTLYVVPRHDSLCLLRRTLLLILAFFFSGMFSPLGSRLSVTSKSPVNHVK
jgi:hypothetical protein